MTLFFVTIVTPFAIVSVDLCPMVDEEKVREAIEKGTVIDIRNSIEFSYEHFPNSINIPFTEIPWRLDEIRNMKKPILTYCSHGYRSGMVAAVLHKIGIDEAHDGGGLKDVQTFISQN